MSQAEKTNIRAKKWFKDNKDRRYVYIKGWNKRNPKKISMYQKRYKMKLRLLVFRYYSKGDIKCACCREKSLEFLTVDHINGDGNIHRRELGHRGGHQMYSWLKNNNFPPGYRILCINCNHSYGVWGYCPHEIPESIIAPL